MASVNKAIIVGNLGKDPEMRYTPNGDPIASFSVATTEKWKGKDGQQQEKTEWHNITIFGKLAEVCGEYLKKGSSVYLEGRIQTDKYTDKQGVEKYSTKIIADRMQMLGGKPEGSPSKTAETKADGKKGKPSETFADMEDDIPWK
jgi:single-strand DNA-binding protein